MNRLGMMIVVLMLCAAPLGEAKALELSSEVAAGTGAMRIAGIIEAYGGREKLANVHSLQARSYQRVYQADNDGWVTSYLLMPDKFRIESELHRNSSIRVLAAGSVWMSDNFDDPLVKGDPLTGEWLTFLFNCYELPFALAEGVWQPVPADSALMSKPAQSQVNLANSSGKHLIITVNNSTNLIDAISGSIGDDQNRVAIGMEFQDYRRVDGVMMPYRIVSTYAGKPYALHTMTEIHINKELSGRLFTPEQEETGNAPATE